MDAQIPERLSVSTNLTLMYRDPASLSSRLDSDYAEVCVKPRICGDGLRLWVAGGFLGLTFREWLASVISLRLWKETVMDTTVRGIDAVVVAELRAAGYMESTVGQYAKTIKALTEFASGREYSAELGEQFGSMTTSVRTGRFSPQRQFDYRRLVAVFDSYVQTGRVDLSVRGRGGGGPRPRGGGFDALDAAWEAEMDRRGLAPATREAYGRVARSYLAFLEGRRITVLDGADGGTVLAFMESLLGRWAKSSLFWVVSNFRPFLKFTGRTDLVDALNVAGVKRSHAIIPVLGDADEEVVVQACASGVVSARDAAITLLALSTGLRSCDIVALRMGDVDWRGHTIGIVQQKTGNPLTLPLPALLLGKLASYVLDERPRLRR